MGGVELLAEGFRGGVEVGEKFRAVGDDLFVGGETRENLGLVLLFGADFDGYAENFLLLIFHEHDGLPGVALDGGGGNGEGIGLGREGDICLGERAGEERRLGVFELKSSVGGGGIWIAFGAPAGEGGALGLGNAWDLNPGDRA